MRANSKGGLIENLEARAVGLGHALGSQLGPNRMDLLGGDLNRISAGNDSVGDLLGLEHADDASHFRGVQAPVQEAPISSTTQQRYSDAGDQDAGPGQAEQHLLGDAQLGEDLPQLLDQILDNFHG